MTDRAAGRDVGRFQWLIIHGRAVGKPFAPLFVLVVSRAGFLPEQQPQFAPCEALYSLTVFGALLLRSLVACAIRVLAGRQEKFGAVRITRGDCAPHVSHGCGSSNSDIGRMSVKGPQASHIYS